MGRTTVFIQKKTAVTIISSKNVFFAKNNYFGRIKLST